MKFEIDIKGLPEGWKAVAYRRPENGEHFFYCGEICSDTNQRGEYIIVEKIQPRRIVLEETPEVFHIRESGYRVYRNGTIQFIENAMGSDIGEKIWREVKQERGL